MLLFEMIYRLRKDFFLRESVSNFERERAICIPSKGTIHVDANEVTSLPAWGGKVQKKTSQPRRDRGKFGQIGENQIFIFCVGVANQILASWKSKFIFRSRGKNQKNAFGVGVKNHILV